MTKTKYSLGQQVSLSLSKESGDVIGIAQYINSQEPLYLIRYVDANGCQIESWWAESAVEIRQ